LYISDNKYESAVDEWKKVFGNDFPKSINIKKVLNDNYKAPQEEFIDEYHTVSINPNYNFKIDCFVEKN
jgi:hypothetical protein